MAYKVFGNPITEETLKGMPEYANKSIITHVDKAHMAFNMKSSVEAQVREYMENLQKKVPGDRVHTFCKIYNATGDIVTFYTKHDYSGKLAEYSVYPVIIKNASAVCSCTREPKKCVLESVLDRVELLCIRGGTMMRKFVTG
ncbi:hypothetical protein ACSBR1_018407 [Camellia fascicularis]